MGSQKFVDHSLGNTDLVITCTENKYRNIKVHVIDTFLSLSTTGLQ